MPVDTGMETGLSHDFYDEDLVGPYMQVATVVNSKFYSLKDFEGAPATADIAFKSLSSSDPETLRHWGKVKEHEPKDVFLWCDFLLVSLTYFDAGLGPSSQKLALKVT